MNGDYYRLPLRFRDIVEQKDHAKCEIKSSIAQNIHLISTTYLGECKFDQSFGCSVWEIDFNNFISDSSFKEHLKESLQNSIKKFEKRLRLTRLHIDIKQDSVLYYSSAKHVKKRINISIKGSIVKTDEPFEFYEYFYVSPLSYY